MIDIKELRIGSHLNFEGKRLKVAAIENLFATQPHISVVLDDKRFEGYEYPIIHHDNLEPILLTAELLAELGFEQGSDESEWHKEIGEAWIGIHLFLDRERMRVTVCDDSADYGNMIVRYLHELENFVWLTLHKELIEE